MADDRALQIHHVAAALVIGLAFAALSAVKSVFRRKTADTAP